VWRLTLEYGSGPGWVSLREIRGGDEEIVEAADSAHAVALLDRLLVAEAGAALGPGQARELAIPDRDRLLAAVYVRGFGTRVESTVRCSTCDQRFDLDFTLDDVLHNMREGTAGRVPRDDAGFFRLRDGRRFRLPSGADEHAVLQVPVADREAMLLRRCVVEGSADADPESLAEAMREAAPLLDLLVEAPCPECSRVQTVRFDLQHYLLVRILDERRLRAWEFHRLARAYGWSRSEILDLSRSQRRLHVELIERDAALR
jgi:hypothetical protein